MSQLVCASYNVFRKNKADVVEADLHQLEKDQGAQLMGLQEVEAATALGVDHFVRRMGWSAYRPKEALQLAMVWNPDIWRAEPFFGIRRLSDKGPVKFTPPTYVIWHGLYHRPSQTRHLVYNAHVMRGYAKEGPTAPKPQGWLDQAARAGLLRLVALTANHSVDHPEYTYRHLWGDLNARQSNRAEWWYPHPLLESLYVRDTEPGSIDYMLHTHSSARAGLKVARRRSVRAGMDSDHPAQVKAMTV